MLGFRVCDETQNFYVCCLYSNPDIVDRNFNAAVQAENVHASSILCVILMIVISGGWVQLQPTVMVLQPLTSQLCLVAISWLSARPMHVVNHLTSG